MNENKKEVKGFFLHFSQCDALFNLPPASALNALKMCREYCAGNEPSSDDPIAVCTFGLMRPALDKSMKMAANGKKGGDAKAAKQTDSKPLANCSKTLANDSKEIAGSTQRTKNKEQDINNNLLCAELGKQATPQEETAIAFIPLSSGEDYPISQEQITEWSKVFPAVDIPYQLGRMKVWCEANPKKKKTRRGVIKFITNWLGNRQDKGGDRTQTEMDTPAPVWVDPHREHHLIMNEIAEKYGPWGPRYYDGETDEDYNIREEKMIAEAVKRGVPEDYARGDSRD